MMRTVRWLALATCVALSGCVGQLLQSKVDEPRAFVLRSGPVEVAEVAYPVQLSVALPTTNSALDVNRIAVLRGHQLDYFLGGRWASSAPETMQSLLLAYLQAERGFKNIVSDRLPVDTDYVLTLELRNFQAEYRDAAEAPAVHVTLVGALLNVSSRETIALLPADIVVVARENRLDAVISAFEAASRQAAQDLSKQLRTVLAKTTTPR